MSQAKPEIEAVEWLAAEASQQTLRRELQRLKRRAKKKVFLVILLALIGVAAVLKKVGGRVPIYQASILMRVTEGELVQEESPLANEGLAHYLFMVALSTERLLPIIEKYDLYPEREGFGDLYAVNELRNYLDIEIAGNYFARGRYEGEPLRTVAITLRFSDYDPNVAFEVAQDLSAVLVVAERERRSQHAKKLSAIAATSVLLIEKKIDDLHTKMKAAQRTIAKRPVGPAGQLNFAEARIAERRLAEDIKQTTLFMESIRAERNYTDLAQAAEGADQALRFEVIDVRRPVIAPKTSPVFYALLGLFVFIVLLPISAIGIAAMDSKLHGIEDVVRLNMPVVGHLPHFPSDRVGSLRERSRKSKLVA